MATLNKVYNIGWYGSCDNQPCVDFDLTTGSDNDNIEAVYRVVTNQSGSSYETYLQTQIGTNLNAFEKLYCGHAYIIKLATGTTVTIPDFIVSNNSNTVSDGYITTECGAPAPTPTITVTPTPTPTPTVTVTPTPTPTITITPTPTATMAITPTVTITPTPTPTPTSAGVLSVAIDVFSLSSGDPNVRDESITFYIDKIN